MEVVLSPFQWPRQSEAQQLAKHFKSEAPETAQQAQRQEECRWKKNKMHPLFNFEACRPSC